MEYCLPFALPGPLSTLVHFPLCLWRLISYQGVCLSSGFLLGLINGKLAGDRREGGEGGGKGQVFYFCDSLPCRSPQVGCVLPPKAKATGFSPSVIQ